MLCTVSQEFHHPWYETPGWETLVLSTASHDESERMADELSTLGWSIYLVANIGEPALAVYRELE